MSVQDPSSRGTFFELSRELRDYCYSLVLISPGPIIAWSGIRPENSESPKADWDFTRDLDEASRFKSASSNERKTALSLLRCNSIIAREAVLIFYGKNKFVFAGDYTWVEVNAWFENIGLRNRTFVTSIELWQHTPPHAWQTASGERVKVQEFDWGDALEPPFPRNPHLYRSQDSTSEGLVETINPAIEPFFKLLGSEGPSKLLITISLRRPFVPGLEVDGYEESSVNYWFTMDLPNVMEKLRTTYANDSVDVIWKGQLLGKRFHEMRQNIEAHWEILEMEEYDRVVTARKKTHVWRWVRFTLKSKELQEPLLAEEPAPFSGFGYYSIEDVDNPGKQKLVQFPLE